MVKAKKQRPVKLSLKDALEWSKFWFTPEARYNPHKNEVTYLRLVSNE